MRSKQFLETARTLLRVARDMADQTVADRLKALAGEYERRAERALRADAEKAAAPRAGVTNGHARDAVRVEEFRAGPMGLKQAIGWPEA